MDGKTLGEALRSGTRVYGTLIVSTSPRWPQALAGAGLDFVFIDTEHIAIDRAQLSWMCQTYRHMGLPPIVRIPSPDPHQATMVLDGGACGIIAPYVETAEQVRALSGAVKLRPLKGQRLRRTLAGEPLEPELDAYLNRANAGNLLIVNVESVPAIEALDDIVAVPGLDAVLVGPHDLSCSLGIPEQYSHPRFEEAVCAIFAKARAASLGAGIHFWSDVEKQVAWLRAGANLLIHDSDIGLFAKHLRADLHAIKQAMGDRAPDRAPGDAI